MALISGSHLVKTANFVEAFSHANTFHSPFGFSSFLRDDWVQVELVIDIDASFLSQMETPCICNIRLIASSKKDYIQSSFIGQKGVRFPRKFF